MPKITYQELKPGTWVKFIDGQAAGPATTAEVAAWRRERSAPNTIWKDVVTGAKRSPQAVDRATPSPPAPDSQQDSFWKDIVKQTRTLKPAEGKVCPPEERGRGLRAKGKEDIDVAEQARIWQDVLRQSKRRVPAEPAAAGRKSAQPQAELARPAKPPASARAAETAAAAITPRSRATAKPAASAKTEPAPAPRRRPRVSKSVGEAQAAASKPKVRSAKGPKVPAKPAVGIAVPRPRAAPATLHKAQKSPVPTQAPENEPAPVAPRPRTRRKPAPEPEHAGPLYLWMVAGQADDMLATVRAGLTRYKERFQKAPEVVLCHSEDLPTLEGARLAVDLREGKSLPRRNFWIGLK